MPEPNNKRLRIIAIVLLALAQLAIITCVLAIFQTRWQLSSPLISETTIDMINARFIRAIYWCLLPEVVAVVAFFLKRYGWSIAASGLVIVLREVVLRYS